jgi:hypothetical protein
MPIEPFFQDAMFEDEYLWFKRSILLPVKSKMLYVPRPMHCQKS